MFCKLVVQLVVDVFLQIYNFWKLLQYSHSSSLEVVKSLSWKLWLQGLWLLRQVDVEWALKGKWHHVSPQCIFIILVRAKRSLWTNNPFFKTSNHFGYFK